MIKGFLLSGAALLAISTAAGAADVTPAPISDWTGFYLGVNAGLATGEFDYGLDYERDIESADPFWDSEDAAYSASRDVDGSGFFAGGQLGYNWQADQFVFGALGDFQWADIDGELETDLRRHSSSPYLLNGLFDPEASVKSEVDWFGTLRLRAGWLVTDNFLTYVTGGAAYGKVKTSYSVSGGRLPFAVAVPVDEFELDTPMPIGGGVNFNGSTSDTQWGWTLGGGAEYKIDENWSFTAEYLYVDLGSQSLVDRDAEYGGMGAMLICEECSVSNTLKIDVDTKFHTLKVGVNYNFW